MFSLSPPKYSFNCFFALLLVIVSLGVGCGRQDQRKQVLIIGIDGADWKVMFPLLQEGRLPNIASLMQRGASAWCKTFRPAVSPVVWTSIATGVGPRKHGIRGFDVPVDPKKGLVVPTNSNVRKVKALWNILSEAQMKVGVVGWWATWPAEAVNGFVISDHDIYYDKERIDRGPVMTAFYVDDEQGKRLIKPRRVLKYDQKEIERLEKLEADTYPPSLTKAVDELYLKPEEISPGDFSRVLHLEGDDLRAFGESTQMDRHSLVSIAKFSYLLDSNRVRVTLKLAKEYRPDLLAVYLQGLDGLEHYAWKYLEPEGFRVTEEELQRYGDLIPNYYVFVDGLIGELLETVDKDAYVVIVSDHGFEAIPPERRDAMPYGKSGDHWYGPPGILVIAGPHTRKDFMTKDAGILDVAPTLLYIMGLPVGEDFDGKVLLDALDPAYVQDHPVRKIRSYGGRKTKPPVSSIVDQEYFERLRALGYVE